MIKQHEKDYFDPANKDQKLRNSHLNQIRGEIVLKIDSYDFKDAGHPDDVFLFSIPSPTVVKNKVNQGMFSGKELIRVDSKDLSKCIIRLNVLFVSVTNFIFLPISIFLFRLHVAT